MSRGRWSDVGAAALLSIVLTGCKFDSETTGASGQLGGTESDGGATTSASTTMSSTPTSEPSTTSEPGTTNDPGTASEPGDASTEESDTPSGTAILQLSEGFDFALVDVDDSATHVFTLDNVGDAPATSVGPAVEPAPFAIASTNCGATLDPDGSCEIEVAFAPVTIGPFAGALAVAYHDGAAEQVAERKLSGGGAGQTRNLIVNPGAESCTGAEIDGWTELVGQNWTCATIFGTVTPHGGATMFFPAEAVNTADLAQDVAVPEEIAKAVSMSDVGLRFVGWSSSTDPGDDPRRFRFEFLDGAGAVIAGATWDSGWDGDATWEQVEDIRIPDPATAAIRVHLDCEVVTANRCSALFDDLQLHFFYPPP